jgi:aromatic ring-opening dioxygenase LigB subunit
MLIFAAFTPHTPLMLPTVGKTARKKLPGTVDGMQRLADGLFEAKPDTIVMISAHATVHDAAFAINLHDEYAVNLSEFGDLATSRSFEPDLGLIDATQRSLRRHGVPVTLDSDGVLDYGSAVPLSLLTTELPRVKIVPISYSGLGAKEHLAFGAALYDVIANRRERIAVVASGDLAHCLSSDAPAGFRPEGQAFDQAVQQAVGMGAASPLLNLDSETVERAAECGYRPLLILLGLLGETRVKPELLSYEAPFGVGYLTAEFQL